MELTLPPHPHEHIKNISTCGVVLIENKLEIRRKTYKKRCKKDPHRIGLEEKRDNHVKTAQKGRIYRGLGDNP